MGVFGLPIVGDCFSLDLSSQASHATYSSAWVSNKEDCSGDGLLLLREGTADWLMFSDAVQPYLSLHFLGLPLFALLMNSKVLVLQSHHRKFNNMCWATELIFFINNAIFQIFLSYHESGFFVFS